MDITPQDRWKNNCAPPSDIINISNTEYSHLLFQLLPRKIALNAKKITKICKKKIFTNSPENSSKAQTSNTDLKGCRILIAEDDPDNQRLLSFILKKAGAEVTVKKNALVFIAVSIMVSNVKREERFPLNNRKIDSIPIAMVIDTELKVHVIHRIP